METRKMQEMFFTIKKRIIITVFLISLCIGCTVDARETERFTEGQKWELVNAFTEKVEYIYNYELWFCGGTTILNEDRKALPFFLYWKNGAYYFIPVEDCNAEVEIEGVSRQVKYNEYQEDCYCFYELRPQSGIGRDEGKWSMQYIASMRMEEMEEFTYLGIVEIDSSGEEMPETTRNFNVPAYNRNHSIISLWKERGKTGFRLPGSAGRDRGENRV